MTFLRLHTLSAAALLSVAALFKALPAPAFGTLPTLYITTADTAAVTSKDVWRPGTRLLLAAADGRTLYATRRAGIRLRGNSTLQKPKKPYALRLPAARSLLGMPPGRKWALLANFMDHSHVRNLLAFAVARETSLDWSPRGAMVDVVVNGRLQGLYLLCETVTTGRGRVPAEGRRGLLVEADVYTGRHDTLVTPLRHLPLQVHRPKHPTRRQMRALRQTFRHIEAQLYRGDSAARARLYRRDLDLQSFADWWIVQELTQNAEPNGPRSCFLHRRGGHRLKAGPVWDFDLAFLSVGLDSGGDLRPARLRCPDAVLLTVDSLYCRRALWYDRLLCDPAFCSLVLERWLLLRPRFAALTRLFAEWRRTLGPSARTDEQLWAGRDPARFDIHPSFDASLDAVEQIYRRRLDTLDTLIRQLATASPPGP